MANEPSSVGDIFDAIDEAANETSEVSLEDLTESFGNRSYGPFLLVPALIEMSPIGGVPGVPTVLALIIGLFAVQIVAGRGTLWLPGFLRRASVSSDRMRGATSKMRPVARWMDRWFHGRLKALVTPVSMKVAALACIVLAATVPFLELIPFASTAPMVAVAAFGLAILVRDGLLMGAAYLLTIGAFAVGIGILAGGGG